VAGTAQGEVPVELNHAVIYFSMVFARDFQSVVKGSSLIYFTGINLSRVIFRHFARYFL
jgi:hypothetical protein